MQLLTHSSDAIFRWQHKIPEKLVLFNFTHLSLIRVSQIHFYQELLHVLVINEEIQNIFTFLRAFSGWPTVKVQIFIHSETEF